MKKILISLVGLLLAGCVSTAPFDQRAYETAIDLKVDSLVLVEQSIEHYTNHVAECAAVLIRARKAHEYAKGIPDNEKTEELWEKINDADQGSLAGYIKDWKEVGRFGEFEVEESIPLIENQFDAIIDLEAAKIRK